MRPRSVSARPGTEQCSLRLASHQQPALRATPEQAPEGQNKTPEVAQTPRARRWPAGANTVLTGRWSAPGAVVPAQASQRWSARLKSHAFGSLGFAQPTTTQTGLEALCGRSRPRRCQTAGDRGFSDLLGAFQPIQSAQRWPRLGHAFGVLGLRPQPPHRHRKFH